MTTLLIHAGRALTPTTEINDAGILIREDVIEAVGPRSGMALPAGAQEIRATDRTAATSATITVMMKVRRQPPWRCVRGRCVRGITTCPGGRPECASPSRC